MAVMALDIGRRSLARQVREARRAGRRLPTVAIVGAGLSGLAMAMQLVRAGTRDFILIEQSEGIGGTWRDNTYPGSGCDVPSHLYSFSFEPKRDWSRRFADQPEILSYAERCVARFGLGDHLRLGTRVDDVTWDEAAGHWTLRCTGRRRRHRSRARRRRGLRLRPAQPATRARLARPRPVHRSLAGTRPDGTTTKTSTGRGWRSSATGRAPSNSSRRLPSARRQ